MNENLEQARESKFTRRTMGRFIGAIGLIFLITGILYSFGLSFWIYISNLNGAEITTDSLTYQTPMTITIIGVITLIIGVLVLYATNQFSRNGIWSLQTGPYVR